MNGAIALDCENTISSPNSTKTTTIGRSQYFFSCRRNAQNSEMTRPLLITTSIHPEIVPAIAVAARVRRPSRGRAAAPRQRVPSRQPPDQADRHEHHEKHDRQQDARVEIADDTGEAVPPEAQPL